MVKIGYGGKDLRKGGF